MHQKPPDPFSSATRSPKNCRCWCIGVLRECTTVHGELCCTDRGGAQLRCNVYLFLFFLVDFWSIDIRMMFMSILRMQTRNLCVYKISISRSRHSPIKKSRDFDESLEVRIKKSNWKRIFRRSNFVRAALMRWTVDDTYVHDSYAFSMRF